MPTLRRIAGRSLRRIFGEHWQAGAEDPQLSWFLVPEAGRLNAARLRHLASLGLELEGKRVLEVGAGIGLLTEFFEQRNCEVVTSDGRPENVAEIARRYPNRKPILLDLNEASPETIQSLGRFDIVFCYGTLYHLRRPAVALALLAEICDGQSLVDTVVALGRHAECHLMRETDTPTEALAGVGCRPTRSWMMETLTRTWGHSYVTRTQPNYPDYQTDWELPTTRYLFRSVFVASKVPLSNPELLTELPIRQPVVSAE